MQCGDRKAYRQVKRAQFHAHQSNAVSELQVRITAQRASCKSEEPIEMDADVYNLGLLE